MKKLVSLIIAGLMAISIVACNNSPVDNSEKTENQQQEENTDKQGGEIVSPEISNEDESIQLLDIHLSMDNEPISVETPEKVLKLTATSEGDATSRYLIVRCDPVEIPSGCTLQYDVYLETDSLGMGSFDMKIHNGIFLGADEAKVDEGGLGLDVESVNLSNYAYNRWYHREFPLHDDGSTVSLTMYRFGVGGLSNGCTNICYYDNIRVVDAQGNVVFEVDENVIADTVFNKANDVSVSFEVVNDPDPSSKRLSANSFIYRYENPEPITGKDFIEVTYNLDDIYSSPVIYIGDYDESCLYGIRGYILICKSGYIYLYRCEQTLTEIASQAIVGLKCGKDFSLRVELNGTEIKGYFVDDMEGIAPWPEFVVTIQDMTGKNFGFMDIYSRGITFKTLEFAELQVAELESYYVNPVILDSADPDILYYEGVYYLYNTSTGYNVYTSTDLVNWELRGNCIDPAFSWAEEALGMHWAPDVEYYNGKFYMVCTIDSQLGIAVAESPLGPFIPEENRLFSNAIDGNIFIDDDGQVYLYFVGSKGRCAGDINGIYGIKFDLETLQVDSSSEALLIFPTEPWERYEDRKKEAKPLGYGVTEGPYMLKHNGLYYLTYSGSGYGSLFYAVGYAVSESPLGPFVKYEGNPIHIGNSNVAGTAHHCFVRDGDSDEFLIFYHNHLTMETVHPRSASVDKARFAPTESGVDRIETYGPTTTPQPMPLG